MIENDTTRITPPPPPPVNIELDRLGRIDGSNAHTKRVIAGWICFAIAIVLMIVLQLAINFDWFGA